MLVFLKFLYLAVVKIDHAEDDLKSGMMNYEPLGI